MSAICELGCMGERVKICEMLLIRIFESKTEDVIAEWKKIMLRSLILDFIIMSPVTYSIFSILLDSNEIFLSTPHVVSCL